MPCPAPRARWVVLALIAFLPASDRAIAQTQSATAQRTESTDADLKSPRVELAGIPDWLKTHRFRQQRFTFVRIQYGSGNGRRGSAWMTDYPDAELNLVHVLGQLSGLDVSQPSRVLRLTDATLHEFPFAYLAEPGGLQLTDSEITALRNYLAAGGFLMTDDFWGEQEWENLRGVMQQVFPDREPQELPLSHPLFHCVFDLQEKPQVTSIAAFMTGNTTERADAPAANYRAITDDDGRIMVLMCHNTDLADGWERVGTDERYRREVSEPLAFPMGVNIVFYALQNSPLGVRPAAAQERNPNAKPPQR